MSTDRDTTRIVRSWLQTDEYESADRVLDAVLDELDTTAQRHTTWWLARRFPFMNTTAKLVAAAAAVIVAAFLGFNYLVAPNIGAGELGDPTPLPTVAEPSVAEPSPSTEEFLLDEGPFVLTSPLGGPPITVTIPAPGWYGEPGSGTLIKNDHGDPPDGAAMIGPWYGELYVYGDPCQWSTTRPDAPATTVDEVVAALTAQASRDASAPVDITVGGYDGKSITLHVPDDAVFSECDQDTFGSWATAESPPSAGPDRYHQGPGQIDELWIVDVDGEVMVIDAMYGDETPAEHVAELRAIVDSMTFER
jgi:hypothetical protein